MSAPTAAHTRLEFQRLGLVDYQQAWDLQKQLHAEVAEGRRSNTVLLLEHPPVYTAGKRTLEWEKPFDGTPVIDVDRGGKITWHGPGQLVGYPILHLGDPIDVVAYVRELEGMLIRVCSDFGVSTQRVEGRSGVWLPADGARPARKVAAIGIRVSRGVTMHGFALNCNPAMEAFASFVPCGITDAGVTSLTQETEAEVRVEDVIDTVETRLRQTFGVGNEPDTE